LIDGLLRYAAQKEGKIELLGFVNGMQGLAHVNVMKIEEESFKYYRNMGGYDYLAKSDDALRTHEHFE